MGNTSKAWPFVRAIGKALTIPGTKIGPSILTDIQDQLSNDDFRRNTAEALSEILRSTSSMQELLKAKGVSVDEQALHDATVSLAEQIYLTDLAKRFLYADFKGIEQIERFVPLPLDEIFIPLTTIVEDAMFPADEDLPVAEDLTAEAQLQGATALEEWAAQRDAQLLKKRSELFDKLTDLGSLTWYNQSVLGSVIVRQPDDDRTANGTRIKQFRRSLDIPTLGAAQSSRQGVDALLNSPCAVVLLGGPGSGKTTMVKALARSLGLGREAHSERFPLLPWCFPVLVPVVLFADQDGSMHLSDFIEQMLTENGGPALCEAFRTRWLAGQCLILLDGLDEVADTSRRIAAARRVSMFVQELGGNRTLLTTRPVGYSVCRLSVPAAHAMLQPLRREDIAAFTRKWYTALDRAVHPANPRPELAEHEASCLLEDICDNPQVESLATNPLVLTIIALIKQQHVVLPQRRVELYDIALNTLIRSWNKARSLSNRHIGRDLSLEETKRVWGKVAFWMHSEVSRGTCHRQRLQRKLVEILMDRGLEEFDAERTAESYIDTATEFSGVLEARGAHIYSFIHQTFQEYLAAWELSIPHAKACERIRDLSVKSRWQEVIRLAVGIVGVIRGDDDTAKDIVQALASKANTRLDAVMSRSLQVAASCVADYPEMNRQISGLVVQAICDRVSSLSYPSVRSELVMALRGMPMPSTESVVASVCSILPLVDVAGQEVALGLLGDGILEHSECARTCVQSIRDAEANLSLKSLATYLLWKAGLDRTSRSVVVMMYWMADDAGCPIESPDSELIRRTKTFLSPSFTPDIRVRAGIALAKWGHASDAVDTFIGVLSQNARLKPLSSYPPVGIANYYEKFWRYLCRAEECLRKISPIPEAIPRLRALLSERTSFARALGAGVLACWGIAECGLPVLREFLADSNRRVRFHAADVLASMGYGEEAADVLVRVLVSSHETDELYRAAELLAVMDPIPGKVDSIAVSLSECSSASGLVAAKVLAAWGHADAARTAVREVCERGELHDVVHAAITLAMLGDRPSAVSVLHSLVSKTGDVAAQLQAADALIALGEEATIAPVVRKLLDEERPGSECRASDVLGRCRPTLGVAREFVGILGIKVSDATIDCLMKVTQETELPEDVVGELADLVQPQRADQIGRATVRSVVFHWVRNCAP